jgi:hypothetical protein
MEPRVLQPSTGWTIPRLPRWLRQLLLRLCVFYKVSSLFQLVNRRADTKPIRMAYFYCPMAAFIVKCLSGLLP